MKQAGIAVAMLVALAVVFGFWASRITSPKLAQPQTQHVLAGNKEDDGTYKYTEAGDGYEIVARYPDHVPLNGGAQAMAKAQLTLEQGVQEQIQSFKADLAQMLTPEEVKRLRDTSRKYSFDMEYKDYGSQNYVSYLYTVYVDTGGAHPNGYFKTFVFNDNTGELVTLHDLFDPSSNWLEELSLLVSNDVVKQMKERTGEADVTGSIFAEGLAPKEENFANFIVDNDTLVIELPPYQVAAYAAGSFEVRIPLKDVEANFKK